MSLAIERVVVQIAPADKRRIEAKAKKMGLPLSELMRRSAFSYNEDVEDANLSELADRAKQSADNSGVAIDDALSFIQASNQRIAAMERKAGTQPAKRSGRNDAMRLAA